MPNPSLQPIVIRFGRLGDMVLLSALLALLHRRYGRPCRLIGAGEWSTEIYRGHPDVAELWCLGRHTPSLLDSGWWSALRALRGSGRDPVYVCEPDAPKLKRVRRLLALGGVDRSRCVFITDPDGPMQEHWVDRLVAFGRRTPPALCASDYPCPTDDSAHRPRLAVLDHERTERDAWIASQGWLGRPLILLQPGNRRTMKGRRARERADDDKAWPIERWIELAHRIHARMPQALIVLCGAPQEAALLRTIEAAARLPALVAAELPLRRLLALCESAHSMISVDTGPAHAAAALGLPLIVLFGSTSPGEWLPRSSTGSAVIGLGGPPVSTRADQISVEAVFDTWCTLRREIQSAEEQYYNAAG